MFDFLKKECALCVIGGAIAGILGYKIAKCPKTREVAVKTIAKGLQAKDCVEEKVANIREDAEDLYSAAKIEAKKTSEPVVETVEEV
ncbi:MAG: DUF6110 family protein [Clostridia bacterium]